MKPRNLTFAVLCALILAVGSYAQSDITWDSSGNGLLNGTYNFRQVVWQVGDEDGNLARQVALTGKLEFDGLGNYTLSAQVMDSQSSALQTTTKTGTYAISASGSGYLSSTIYDKGKVFGLVSQGVFIGSSTEEAGNQQAVNDLLIAAPAASPAQTNSSLSGRYWVAETNFPGLDPSLGRDAFFQMNADGNGNLGTLNARGFIGARTRATTQTLTNATYSFNNGTGRMSYGGTLTSTNLLAGERVLFLSPDGNLVFGGSPDGWNMFVGVRALADDATKDTANGLYYQAGLDAYIEDGFAEFYSYYGGQTIGSGFQVNHQRLYTGFDDAPYDYVFGDPVELSTDGSWEDFIGFHNVVGAGGAIIIGYGLEQAPGISIALKAPSLSGTGVYLNPTGVKNAAGMAPFTYGVSRGELISLSGTGLASAPAEDSNFPTTLGGVQVMINGRPAPIKSVSSEQVTAIIPYATTEAIAKIQVINNGAESNAVTMYVNPFTSPGPVTVPEGGFGYAKALHADGSEITTASPAKIGETVSILLAGLGDVDPPVLEGTIGPENPRSKVKTAEVGVLVSGEDADVLFAGLAPGLIGVYRIDFLIAAGTAAGDRNLAISTPDAYSTRQIKLPVSGTRAAEVVTERKVRERRKPEGWHPKASAVRR